MNTQEVYSNLVTNFPVVTATLAQFRSFTPTQWNRIKKTLDEDLREALVQLERCIKQDASDKRARAKAYLAHR